MKVPSGGWLQVCITHGKITDRENKKLAYYFIKSDIYKCMATRTLKKDYTS